MPELITIAGVADVIGVSQQQADRLSKQDGFPGPVADVGRRRVWQRADVERWAQARVKSKGGRPRKEQSR